MDMTRDSYEPRSPEQFGDVTVTVALESPTRRAVSLIGKRRSEAVNLIGKRRVTGSRGLGGTVTMTRDS